MIKKKTLLPILLFASYTFLLAPQTAYANTFDDVVNGFKNTFEASVEKVKELFKEDFNVKNKDLVVEQNITLVDKGDIKRNKDFDAGDTVRFSYTITNNTDQNYDLATLKTNVNKKQINYVRSLSGTQNINTDTGKVEIPNLIVKSRSSQTISFDATVNYFEEDKQISSEPELISSDNKPLTKASLKQINVKKITKEELKQLVPNAEKAEKPIEVNSN